MAQSISDERILSAALDVIARHGYDGATTRAIAAAAGINEVTLFRRFGNKKKLLMAVVEQQAQLFGARNIHYTGDVVADLESVVDFYLELVANRGPVLVMMMAEAQRQPEVAEVMQYPLRFVLSFIAILQQYQDDGVLRRQSPAEQFATLLGPVFLGAITQQVAPPAMQMQFTAPSLVRSFLSGHRVGETV